jgi:hypothetical protein
MSQNDDGQELDVEVRFDGKATSFRTTPLLDRP